MNLTSRYLGLTLKHPFMPGASPLSEDLGSIRRLEDAGASAIVLHSLFEEQLTQEELATFSGTEGYHNLTAEASSFLPEPESFSLGPNEYLEHLRKAKAAVKVPVIASLNGITPSGWLDFAKQLEQAGADAIELNMYRLAADPALTGQEIERLTLEIVRSVKAAVKVPLAVKLSPFYSSLSHFGAQLVAAGASGLVLFNRFYQPDIDIDALEVKRALRLSDSSELPLRVRWLAILSPQLKVSLAASGGVHNPVDGVRAVMAGAHAVQLVSSLLRNGPDHLTQVVRGVAAFMEEKGYESMDQMRGSMSLKSCPDPTAYERANYVHMLRSWRGEL